MRIDPRLHQALQVSGALAFFLTACATAARAQARVLVPQRTIPISGSGSLKPVSAFPFCDARGDIYTRAYLPGPGAQGPAIKIAADGTGFTIFSLGTIPGPDSGFFPPQSLAPDGTGGVYIAGSSSQNTAEIVRFDAEGQYISTVKLQRDFTPDAIVALADGNFLLSGIQLDKELSRQVGEMTGPVFTGIFDGSGRLVKTVQLPGDVDPAAQLLAARQKGVALRPGQDPVIAIHSGSAVLADDHNVYLERAAQNPMVYVLSPEGALLRKLVLEAPSPEGQPLGLKVAGGRIAVEFVTGDLSNPSEPQSHLYAEFDAKTGKPLGVYQAPASLLIPLACYSPGRFTFLERQSGEMAIVQTAPR